VKNICCKNDSLLPQDWEVPLEEVENICLRYGNSFFSSFITQPIMGVAAVEIVESQVGKRSNGRVDYM